MYTLIRKRSGGERLVGYGEHIPIQGGRLNPRATICGRAPKMTSKSLLLLMDLSFFVFVFTSCDFC